MVHFPVIKRGCGRRGATMSRYEQNIYLYSHKTMVKDTEISLHLSSIEYFLNIAFHEKIFCLEKEW